MSRDRFPGESPDIAAEACAWLAQLETGELTAADREAFHEWMSRSPRHSAEIRRLAEMSMQLNVLAEMAEPIDAVRGRHRPAAGGQRARRPVSRWRTALITAAAGAVVAALFLWRPDGIVPGDHRAFATAVGEQREINLSDGTRVTLNTDSRLEIDYDEAERRVRLFKGEAFFDVVPNGQRPFLVYAGGRYVRAVGTAFVVRLLQEDFTVTVVEGRIELADTAERASGQRDGGSTADTQDLQPAAARTTPLRSVFLEAGQSMTIPGSSGASPVVSKSERDLRRELSWQEGLHDFSETPLDDVIREVSRYSPLEVEIADPALHDIRFGGIFRIGETQPLLDALQASYGVQVEYVGESKVRLSLVAQDSGRPRREAQHN